MSEPPPPSSLPTGAATPGTVLCGRYHLRRLLAVGGMAEVWEADDQLLHRLVAVKVLHRHLAADPGFVERFRSEAVAAARLHHPGIVAVFDTCSDAGLEAIVLELVQGHTLREHLDEAGPLPVVDVVDIGTAVADALDEAHRGGLVHRDVKPANVLLCDDDRVLITDFGIAKVVDTTDRTATGTMLGSVKYLSPEQVQGQRVDGRSDVFSLGVVLYECLAGRPPWLEETPAATALARLHVAPPDLAGLRPDVPDGMVAVVGACLTLDRDRRLGSAREVVDALGAVRRGAAPAVPSGHDATVVAERPPPVAPAPPAAAPPAAPTASVAVLPEAPPPPPRRRWPTVLAITLLVGVGLGVVALLLRDTEQGKQVLDRVGAGDLADQGPLPIAGVQPFDPEGGDGEREDLVAGAVDGDAATAWQTEGYRDGFAAAKRGVGLQVDLAEEATVRTVVVDSPTTGWSATVHVADAPGATLEDWGPALGSVEGVDGDAEISVEATAGQHVLVWFTDVADPDADGDFRMVVEEIEVRG